MNNVKTVNPLEGNLLKNMLYFALPVMGMMILSMLFSSMDTMVIGRFGHENAVSAIGVSGAFINMVSGGLTSLGGGVTILFSNLYGQGKREEIRRLVNALPLTCFILGTAAALVMFLSARPILELLNCPEEILSDAILYFRIYFMSMAVSLPYQFMAGALNAKGDSLSPFKFEFAANVINIGLNLFTVIVLDWNIFGVAIATLLSQVVSLMMILRMFRNREDELHLDGHALRAFKGTGEIFRLGIPSSLEGMIINFSGVVISAYINSFSPDVIAGNTIGQAIEGFVAVSFVGFADAGVVFVGQNYGANDLARVRKSYRISTVIVLVLGEALGMLIYLAAPVLIGLFTTSPVIAACAQRRMFWMCLFYGLCGGQNVVSGCVRGLKDTSGPLVVSILCSLLLRLSWVIFYAGPSGNISLIYASYPLCWGLNTVLSALLFEFDFLKIKKAGKTAV